MDGVVLTVGGDEATEAAAETCKTGDGGVDTNTHGDDAEHNERYGHCERCLMRGVVGMELLVLCAPEDAVVKTEHIECGHGGYSCHNPSYKRTVGKACGDNLVLGAEAREERNTGDGKAGDEEGDVGDGHILAQSAHCRHLVAVDGVDDTSGTEEQAGLEHGVGEEVEH